MPVQHMKNCNIALYAWNRVLLLISCYDTYSPTVSNRSDKTFEMLSSPIVTP